MEQELWQYLKQTTKPIDLYTHCVYNVITERNKTIEKKGKRKMKYTTVIDGKVKEIAETEAKEIEKKNNEYFTSGNMEDMLKIQFIFKI